MLCYVMEFFGHSILPTKLEQVLTQLEAEPAGVGLDPAAVYPSVENRARSGGGRKLLLLFGT